MIRNRHLIIAVALSFTACGAPPSNPPIIESEPADGGPIQFKTVEISTESTDCEDNDAHCAQVRITTMHTTGGGTEIARDNLDLFISHDLVSRLRGFLPEEIAHRSTSTEALAAAFLAQHRAFVTDFPEAPAQWFVTIETSVVFSSERVTTIDIRETAYTGGAHPNTRQRLVSFDIESGQLLGIEDLTTDAGSLVSLVDRQFRVDRGLEPDADLAAEGFWIPEEGLAIPDNLGVVAEGLRVHWDPYEIAPYSMGPVDVTVPAQQLIGVVDTPYW